MSTLNKGCLVIQASCSPSGRERMRTQRLGLGGPQGRSAAHKCEGLPLIPSTETHTSVYTLVIVPMDFEE